MLTVRDVTVTFEQTVAVDQVSGRSGCQLPPADGAAAFQSAGPMTGSGRPYASTSRVTTRPAATTAAAIANNEMSNSRRSLKPQQAYQREANELHA